MPQLTPTSPKVVGNEPPPALAGEARSPAIATTGRAVASTSLRISGTSMASSLPKAQPPGCAPILSASGGRAEHACDPGPSRLRSVYFYGLATTLRGRSGTLIARVPDPAQSRNLRRYLRMNLKPLGDRLIVQAIEEEATTASGLVLPDTAKEKPQKGKVVAVGDGPIEVGERRPLDVSEGDEVLYSKYGGTEIKVDGEELLVLRESDVLAKVL